MNTIIWLAFGLVAMTSYIPVVGLFPTRKHHNYQALLMLSLTVFLWTIVVGLSFITNNANFLYYLKLLIYPIVFLMSYYIFLTVMAFTSHKVPKIIHILAWLFFTINLVISLTNHLHQWVLKITLFDTINLDAYLTVETGFFFLVHTLLSYILLFFAFLHLIKHLNKEKKRKRDSLSLYLILTGIVVGVFVNMIHVFVYTFYLDPSYIFSVLMSSILYYVIYKRDFNLAIITTSRLFILEHMREKYMIYNDENELIACSKDIIQTYGCSLLEKTNMSDCLQRITQKAVVYDSFDQFKQTTFQDKKYYHLKREDFKIPGFNQTGHLILLYDETSHIQLLYEIDLLKSKDMMTNLYNRNYFEENHREFEKKYEHMGVIYFDMNALKVVNDYFGHKAGDEKLVIFAKHLISANKLFEDTVVIRLGGDEFLMMIKNANEHKLKTVIEHMKEKCHHENVLENISFSYGLAIRKGYQDSLNEVMKRADELLYENKKTNQEYRHKLIDYIVKQK